MEKKTYLADPCGASSLPFWKTEEIRIPEGMSVIREDRFDAERHTGADEPYFKLVHRLEEIPRAGLPAGFSAAACGTDEFARHMFGILEIKSKDQGQNAAQKHDDSERPYENM